MSVAARLLVACSLVALACDTVPLGAGRPGPRAIGLITDTESQGQQASTGALVERLRAMGFAVVVIDQRSAQLPTEPPLSALIVSSVATASDVALPLRDLPLPLCALESYYWPALGLTGSTEQIDFWAVPEAELEIVPASPWGNEGARRVEVLAGVSFENQLNVGVPSAAAAIWSRLPSDPTFATTFSHEAGDLTVGGPAAGRRLALFLRTESVSAAPSAAWLLFEAAVRWLVR